MRAVATPRGGGAAAPDRQRCAGAGDETEEGGSRTGKYKNNNRYAGVHPRRGRDRHDRVGEQKVKQAKGGGARTGAALKEENLRARKRNATQAIQAQPTRRAPQIDTIWYINVLFAAGTQWITGQTPYIAGVGSWGRRGVKR